MKTLRNKVILLSITSLGLWSIPSLMSGAGSISWDFSSGQGVQGWVAKQFAWTSSGGGWDDDLVRTASGWQDSSGATSIVNNGLGSTGYYAQSPVGGDLSSYIGGTLSLSLADPGASSSGFPSEFGPNGGILTEDGEYSFPHTRECFPYVFMSGMVNGNWVLLGHHVQFSDTTQSYSISLDNNHWTPFEITVTSSGLPGSGVTEIAISAMPALTEEMFAELMANSDGVAIRTEWKSGSVVGGSGPEPMTIIDSVSLTAIPEPSTYALAGAIGIVGLIVMRRIKRP